jgi:transmembrane 9 superfamily protein 2/4
LQIKVGKLNSIKTQFPLAFYNLAVCNDRNYTREAENLGEILSGGYVYSTKYDVKMKTDEYCKLMCKRNINDYEKNLFGWVIEREYNVDFYLDSLPAGLNYTYKNGVQSDRVIYDHGIPIGEHFGNNKFIVYNHYTFLIFVNNDIKSENKFSIVEFNIIPWRYNRLLIY